jgi:hypothetical protein
MSALTMRTPRWLGWVLLIAGASHALLWGFVIVVIALFAEEPWGDMAGELLALWLLGVLAAIAGIRILRGTSRTGMAETT